VNVSLGYSKGFTNPQENYLPADMDGKTSAIARAVDTAFFRKNMLIVVSAGNEGDDHSWRVLSTPGDARGALSVGATKLIIWDKIGYSSEGTPTLDYIKPEIACFSASGTSFSAPVLTGLAAGIFQYDSTRTAAEVKQLIMASGHLYPYGNDRLGYGVPRCDVLWQLLTGHTVEGAGPQVVHADNDRFVIRQQWERNYIVAYHKGHDFHVLAREVFRPTGERLRVRRFNGAGQTTLLIGDKVMEIIWEH
ncbi:MAG: S8 family serine peptidase, partial [Cyclobacteriaceae bacterium]|nr:S8 family serine peptidase [Cyclobacteriaceae bacterium]